MRILQNCVSAILITFIFSCSTISHRKPCSVKSNVDPSSWHGFNLTDMFWKGWRDSPFQEDNFRWIHDFGFNFVRLPLDYRIWTDPNDLKKLNEDKLKQVDQAIQFGQKYHIHVCINLHHAPGYTSGDEPDGKNLWTEPATLQAFLFQWKNFATRYKGVSSEDLSFNLLNEPANIDSEAYQKLIRVTASSIWEIDPERLIIADGLNYGKTPVPELSDLPIIQSNRGYDPSFINSWNPKGSFPVPTWPMSVKIKDHGDQPILFDRNWLYHRNVEPWQKANGVRVFVGEFGAHKGTPHKAVLAWMEDNLKNWQEAHWGWALWNFNGEFGVLDSARSDVVYENFNGHQLDREMLNLLQKYR